MRYVRNLIILALFLLNTVQIFGQEIDLGNKTLDQYREKTALITDRNIYLTGEKLWFYVWASSSLDTVYSKTVYVELYNGEKIIQRKYSLENGYSKGFIEIPNDYNTSGFILRAYTNYQKNFLPEHYAHQVLYIVNVEKGIPPVDKPEDVGKSDRISSATTENSYNLILDSTAKTSAKLHIVEANGQITVNFFPDSKLALPENIRYVVRNSNFQIVKDEKLENNKFYIPVNKLTSGFNYYLIYKNSIPYVLGVIYSPGWSENQLINKQKIAAKTRTRIKMPEFTNDNSQNTVVSITRKGTRFTIEDSTIAYSLLVKNPYLINSLNNIFPGLNSIPVKYRKEALKNHAIAIKNDPKFIAKMFVNSYSFLPEIYDLNIEGEVRKSDSNEPVSDGLIYLSLFDSNSQLHVYKTLKDGSFIFNLENKTGINNAYLTMDSVKSGSVEILVRNSFSNDFYIDNLPMVIDTSYLELLENMNLVHQIRSVFNVKDSLNSFSFKPIPSIARFGESIYLKDYIDLPTLIDVFREIIPGASVKHRKGKQLFSVTDGRRMFVYDEPLVLLDNIPIFNNSGILSLNPLKIEKISVVEEPIYLGDHKIEGVISLNTYKSDFGEITFSGNTSFLKYQTYTPTTSFTPSIPKSENLPHFSNTLFWKAGRINPTILNINTDDGNGKYDLHIYNIGESGETNSVYHAEIDVVINEELE